jgi:hypothetical protein
VSNVNETESESSQKPNFAPKRAALVIVVDALVEDFSLADAAAKRIAQQVRFNSLDATGKVLTGEALATFARCDAATFILAMEALGKSAAVDTKGESHE